MRPFPIRVLFKVREMDMKRIIYSSLKLLLIVCVLSSLYSCKNTCEPVCCGGEKESSLFFTALSENDGVPLVFELSSDFSDINVLAENARLYSAPAANGDYCYSRENNQNGKTEIFLSNQINRSEKNITENIANYDYTYPVISPLGGAIAMNSQDNRLYLYSYSSASEQLSIISSALLPKSAASFSTNGRYINFFSGAYPNVTLNIYDVINNEGPFQIYQFKNIIDNRRGQVIADWANDNENICFAYDRLVDKDTIKSIYVVNISGVLTAEISNNKLGFQQVTFSPENSNELLFSSESGDMWIVDKSLSEPLFVKLTNNQTGEINANPNWSANATKIVFTKYFDDSKEDSELYMLDMNTKDEMLIANKVFSAYWRR